MSIQMRNYQPEAILHCADYRKVRTFLRQLNKEGLPYPGFTWSRWEWMITHTMLDRSALHKIGIWEDDGKIVGLAAYESSLGDGYLFAAKGYEFLKGEMLNYAKGALVGKNGFRVLIDDADKELQRLAQENGFVPIQDGEETAVMDIANNTSYTLPKGYHIISMADGWDYAKYNKVMWRGFNHEGAPPETPEALASGKQMLSSPMIEPELILAVTAPNEEYVAHAGLWYAPGDSYAYVEPVCTDPSYRRQGLGKAAVLEAVKRCGALGAGVALVGSSQQFYYRIGFRPLHKASWWVYTQ